MEYKLKNPILVYNKDAGESEEVHTVVVSFTGKKGLKSIKRLQDVIFKTFQDTANSDVKKEVKEENKDRDISVDEMLDMLEMTGASEKIFDEVSGTLKAFASVRDKKLSEDLQEQMDMDDLSDLCNEVMKTFLLPKIIQKMNNMKK